MYQLIDEFWQIVGVSALCGAVIGLERQLREKPAGIRTSILICLGTAMFIRLGVLVSTSVADPTRVLGHIIAGIGFIGAGVMMAREGLVSGVTSAAVIWVLAAIGCVVGFGHYGSAIALSVVSVAITVGIQILERSIQYLRRGDYANNKRDADGPL